MIQKIKCLLGFHEEKWLGYELPFYQQILMKCSHCGKYNLWHTGKNIDHWTKNINDFPKEVRECIRKNNL
ncbi:hypothetical protein [Clostridium botulinum]|uniref:hypothetical protein n=1 Tax=Clostridium botulinum TaxID=1491 RepID=UPI000773EC89|nr:hypothetical protein [Clostridium botulinum]APH20861.1 hypothetical protein NPD1_4219 [Clostridium botulinum]APQ71119.1 hypothetical protein RSJ8_4176 [Clostridium botulinum]MBN3352138.1 hypothetical protein [Clostridium botulinum]MBN3379221.1 hypothetical protein [Clostridium botulinum]